MLRMEFVIENNGFLNVLEMKGIVSNQVQKVN